MSLPANSQGVLFLVLYSTSCSPESHLTKSPFCPQMVYRWVLPVRFPLVVRDTNPGWPVRSPRRYYTNASMRGVLTFDKWIQEETLFFFFWSRTICCEAHVAGMPTVFFSSCLNKMLPNEARKTNKTKRERDVEPGPQDAGSLGLSNERQTRIILANPTNKQ